MPETSCKTLSVRLSKLNIRRPRIFAMVYSLKHFKERAQTYALNHVHAHMNAHIDKTQHHQARFHRKLA